MDSPVQTTPLERIAVALESISLFLHILVDGDAVEEHDTPSANVVMTQHGPIELR